MNALTHNGSIVDGVAGFGLDPKFSASVAQLLATCRAAGFEFRVTSGLRTPQVQAEYYCRWSGHSRTQIDAKIKFLTDNNAPWLASILQRYRDIPQTKAKLTGQLPGSGWHQWGLAADAYCFRDGHMVEDGSDPCYEFYAQQATRLGLTAGYYLKFKDSGHVQGPSADGADEVYTWSYIDRTMKERFSEKTTIALSRSSRKGVAAQAAAASAGVASDSKATPKAQKATSGAKKQGAAAGVPVPPPATKQDIAVKGGKVYGPGNIAFGNVKGPGLFNNGVTTIDAFFNQDPTAFPNTPACRANVIRAVSTNEGRIEAINTYDDSFLSCGVFQWTAGQDGAAGELPGLLALLKGRSPATFSTYFGSVGLDILVPTANAGKLSVGYFTLDGDKLDTAAKKDALRDNLWAYRFWRAAHDQEVRRAQIALAMGRLDVFYKVAITGQSGLTVQDFISSEYGVALLLDEHVNRPGHVPKTLMAGVGSFISKGGERDPSKWTDEDEAKVLQGYLTARAKTNMTNSKGRASAIRAQVTAGQLSAKRGSFA